MKVLIVEDEIHTFNSLKRALNQLDPSIQIEGPVTDVVTLIDILSSSKAYDAIFSDIRLDDGLCFEAFAAVETSMPVVFTTAYDEYAIQAFQNNGIAYLLKPVSNSELEKALVKVRSMIQTQQSVNLEQVLAAYGLRPKKKYKTRFLINDFDGAHILEVSDISHIEKQNDKVVAFLNNGRSEILTTSSLDELESMLDPESFFRANRQFIVNSSSIHRIVNSFRQKLRIKLKSYPDLLIEVSKERATELRNWLDG